MKPRATRGSVLQDRVTASDLEAGTGRSVQGKRGSLVLGVESMRGRQEESSYTWALAAHGEGLELCCNLIRSLGHFYRQF